MDLRQRNHDTDHEVLSVEVFRQMYNYHPPEEPTTLEKFRKKLTCSAATVAKYFPILKWLPKYKFKENYVGDIVAGLTVAVMHIPHGLAYAPLAGQMPVVGLYMAVFPSIIYLFLGTSRHISLGTFAIICMMVGKSVSTYATNDVPNNGTSPDLVKQYSNLEVNVAICFLTGAMQFVMGILKLGSLWVILSNSLVSGFTTGAAIHVVIYQVKNLLGINVKRFTGPLKLVYTVIDIVKNVPETNLVTLGFSCGAIIILATFNDHIKPLIKKKFPQMKVPIPMELIVIIIGILLSNFLNINNVYDVDIVGDIPSGLPEPVLPSFELFPVIAVDCFVIAIVGISMSLSLASIFAKKSGYEIDANQELIAYGASNLFSSFFHCVPSSASLSRSLVQHAVGGKSLIAYVCTIVTMILLLSFLGTYFEPVPYAVLSSIVAVTLKGLLWQVQDFPGIWKLSKVDGAVWLTTILSVVFLDLDYGLAIGLAVSVISLVLRGQEVKVECLGKIPQTNIFLDSNVYGNVEKPPNAIFLKVIGTLHFANASNFSDKVFSYYSDFTKTSIPSSDKLVSTVVLDFSCVPSVDPSGVSNLLSVYDDLKCDLFICDCNAQVYDFLDHCKFFDKFPKKNVLCSTFDAAEYLNSIKSV